MFSFPDVMDLFAYKLSRLGRERFTFTCVFSGAFNCFLFGNKTLLTDEVTAILAACAPASNPRFTLRMPATSRSTAEPRQNLECGWP